MTLLRLNKRRQLMNTGVYETTVLMTCYKRDSPELLFRAISSCFLRQTLAVKVLLIVDGSIEISLKKVIEKCIKLYTAQFEVIWKATNSGLADSLNIGIQHINTKYIARLDADDICAIDRFSIQKDFLTDGGYDIVGGSILEFGIINERIRMFPRSTQDCINSLPKRSPFNHPSIFCKTSILKENKYRTNLFRDGSGGVSSTEDLELWFRLFFKGYKGGNIDKVVTYHRINENFFKRRGSDKAWMEYSIYNSGIKMFSFNPVARIYPALRLVTRLSPMWLKKVSYLLRKNTSSDVSSDLIKDLKMIESL